MTVFAFCGPHGSNLDSSIEAILTPININSFIIINERNFENDGVIDSSSLEAAIQNANDEQNVILYGHFIYHLPEILRLCDEKFFFDTDKDQCLINCLRKEPSSKSEKLLDQLDTYDKVLKTQNNDIILPSRKHADLILPRLNSINMAIITISLTKTVELQATKATTYLTNNPALMFQEPITVKSDRISTYLRCL